VSASGQAIIVCPLAHERRCIARHGVGRHAVLHCCGVGADSVRRWATELGRREGVVLLVGVAGALSPSVRVGEAHVIQAVTEVRDGTEVLPHPPLATGGDATVLSTDQPVLDPSARRSLAAETGAELVDLESAAFARAASTLGWRWGIVRGVSDDGSEGLPASIGEWIDPRGRVRPARICVDLVRNPSLIGRVRRLRRQSDAALKADARKFALLEASSDE
jgi:nucleoside phosphorylase